MALGAAEQRPAGPGPTAPNGTAALRSWEEFGAPISDRHSCARGDTRGGIRTRRRKAKRDLSLRINREQSVAAIPVCSRGPLPKAATMF